MIKKNIVILFLTVLVFLLLGLNIYFYSINHKLENKIEVFKPAAQKIEVENSKLRALCIEQLEIIKACNDTNLIIKPNILFPQETLDSLNNTTEPKESEFNFKDLNK